VHPGHEFGESEKVVFDIKYNMVFIAYHSPEVHLQLAVLLSPVQLSSYV